MNLDKQSRMQERRERAKLLMEGVCAGLLIGLFLILIMFAMLEGLK